MTTRKREQWYMKVEKRRPCDDCGTEYTYKMPHAKRCQECRRKLAHRMTADARKRAAAAYIPKPCACDDCDKLVPKTKFGGQAKYCSIDCRRKQTRRNKRIWNPRPDRSAPVPVTSGICDHCKRREIDGHDSWCRHYDWRIAG